MKMKTAFAIIDALSVIAAASAVAAAYLLNR